MSNFDTIILGSSPNALTTAAYLAKAGQRVLVLEPAANIGSVVSTAYFGDQFQADTGLIGGRLDSTIIKDLQLTKHGLDVIERNTITSLLSPNSSLTLSADAQASIAAINNLSANSAANDASRYTAFMHLLDMATRLLQTAYASIPPEMHHPNQTDSAQLLNLAGQLRGYGRREMTEVMRLLVMPVRDLLNEWFESAELKGLLASLGVRGLMQGPFVSGTVFNLLHHLAIGDGYFRATAKGGLGAISRTLTVAAQSYGAEIRTNTGSFKVALKDGVATGVQLENGEVIAASQIISDYDARYTFTKLVPPPELEPEFNRAVQYVRYNGNVARINLALSALPQFPCNDAALRGTMVVAPNINYLEKAFDKAKYGELTDEPYLEFTIPTLADPSLAPEGQHILSIWLQYMPYRGNYDAKAVYQSALNSLTEFAPDLYSLVLQSQVLLPQDFEALLNLSEGHLYGGEMSLAQTLFLRPIPGFAQHRTPIANLYMCGSATHPGGGVSGLAGRNLANQILNYQAAANNA